MDRRTGHEDRKVKMCKDNNFDTQFDEIPGFSDLFCEKRVAFWVA